MSVMPQVQSSRHSACASVGAEQERMRICTHLYDIKNLFKTFKTLTKYTKA